MIVEQLQELVNAQIELNRAVALANTRWMNRTNDRTYFGVDVSDRAIKRHVMLAMEHLGKVSGGLLEEETAPCPV